MVTAWRNLDCTSGGSSDTCPAIHRCASSRLGILHLVHLILDRLHPVGHLGRLLCLLLNRGGTRLQMIDQLRTQPPAFLVKRLNPRLLSGNNAITLCQTLLPQVVKTLHFRLVPIAELPGALGYQVEMGFAN